LRGRAIPFLSRIIAVADAFETMTADRSYRPGLGVTVAAGQLQAQAGTQFDADLVPVFLRAVG
jgi:HD-GYP domain-containing protein (c-di-GMP phosphodiesterase class II)